MGSLSSLVPPPSLDRPLSSLHFRRTHSSLFRSSIRRPNSVRVPTAFRHKQTKKVLRSTPVICSSSSSLYAVLGVERDVSLSSIKTAYRHMARRYHPDVCRGSDAENCTKMFLQVQEAYEVLSDPERRADYDYTLLHPFCAQALGKGFSSNFRMSHRKPRSAANSEVSAAWKLQWEAQVNRLKQRQQSATESARNSWAARARCRNVTRDYSVC